MVRGLLLALSGCAFIALLAACGGDSGGTAAAASPSQSAAGNTAAAGNGTTVPGTSSGSSSLLSGPAGKYSLLHEDVGKGYLTDIKGTYVETVDNYSGSQLFGSKAEGQQLLTKWGYQGGYETALTPEGGDTAVLQGGYVIRMEIQLFKDAAGAQEFYKYALQKVNAQAQPVKTDTVGDESSTNVLVAGKIGKSTVDYTIHQTVFRRANMVAVMLTIGAQPFMKADTVVGLAKMVDEKTQGKRQAIDPTPTSNFTPPVYPTSSVPTPAGR
jgi:hypothetical protein